MVVTIMGESLKNVHLVRGPWPHKFENPCSRCVEDNCAVYELNYVHVFILLLKLFSIRDCKREVSRLTLHMYPSHTLANELRVSVLVTFRL